MRRRPPNRIPDGNLTLAGAAHTGCQKLARGSEEGHTGGLGSIVAGALADNLSSAGVDDADELVLGRGGEVAAIVAEGDAVDRVRVNVDVAEQLACGDVPEKNLDVEIVKPERK